MKKMKKIIKQVLGVDVAQKELVVCLGRMYDDLSLELYARQVFANNSKGFISLMAWVNKSTDPSIPVVFVMEATGVYHESFAYFLDSRSQKICIVLPNKISNYIRTLTINTITDKTAADAICQFGIERKLDIWHKPDTTFKQMKQLTRERDQIISERTACKNQLHAEMSEAESNKSSKKRLEERIKLLDKQIGQINEELKTIVSSEQEILKNVKLLCTIPGVGTLTACTILAETDGFDLIRSKKQLTSYAGLDVREKQSGTSIKGKPKISKKGNRYLRKAMHFPALAAIRHNERYKAVFARIVQKHGIKMKAAVAIQRKLLELSYILYKTQKPFDAKLFEQSLKIDIKMLEIKKEVDEIHATSFTV
jgi:transposase